MAGIATIRRGTTPTLTVRTSFDLIGWRVWLTVGTKACHVTLGPDSLEVSSDAGGSVVVGTLGQRQTLALRAGQPAGIQLRAVRGTQAVASAIGDVVIADVIQGGEVV